MFAVFTLATILFCADSEAGCYECDADCCDEAPSNTSGLSACSNSVMCLGTYGCACYNCRRSGSACTGSGPAECESDYGACEEHQSVHPVPNGSLAVPGSWHAPPPAELSVQGPPSMECSAT